LSKIKHNQVPNSEKYQSFPFLDNILFMQSGGSRGRRRSSFIQTMTPTKDLEGVRPQSSRRHTFAIVLGLAITVGVVILATLLLTLPPHKNGQALSQRYSTAPLNCFQAPSVPEDRRKDKKHLKIANFNAEWLFLFGGRGGIRCPAESCPWSTINEAMSHLSKVADMLAKIDADIVHLSEVEDCRVLSTLLKLIPGDHGYKPYIITGKDHATGQNVALLTRIDPFEDIQRTEKRGQYPVPQSTCGSNGPKGTIGVTKHYIARIKASNEKGKTFNFLFAGLHFLARPSDKTRCPQREAQAVVLRDLVRSKTMDGEYVVILGDFNDYDPLAIGVDNRKPISATLPILYQSSGRNMTIRNAAGLVPVEDRYSCWFDVNQNCRVDGNKERVMIDHILLDSRLNIVEAKFHHDYEPTCEDRVSDHWPFSVKLRL
jgi:exonuclease III